MLGRCVRSSAYVLFTLYVRARCAKQVSRAKHIHECFGAKLVFTYMTNAQEQFFRTRPSRSKLTSNGWDFRGLLSSARMKGHRIDNYLAHKVY